MDGQHLEIRSVPSGKLFGQEAPCQSSIQSQHAVERPTSTLRIALLNVSSRWLRVSNAPASSSRILGRILSNARHISEMVSG